MELQGKSYSQPYLSSLPPSSSLLPPPLPQVVYVFGGQTQVFCAVAGVGGQSVEYLPSSWKNVALWFGVTAFLFCVHSMVRCVFVCACVCVHVCVRV